MENLSLGQKKQEKLEGFVLFFYSMLQLEMLVTSIRNQWENWIAFFLLTQLLGNWILYIGMYKDFKFRTIFSSIIMQAGFILYASQQRDVISSVPIFLGLSLLTALYGVRQYICIPVVSFTYLLFYHTIIIKTIQIAGIQDVENLLFQAANIYLIEYLIYFWLKKRNEQNKKLMAIIQKLEDMEQSKNDFLANVSHEIRTPIHTICGMSEIVQREDDLMKIREDVFQIQTAGKNLMSVVGDILDFSELQSGKMEIAEESYNITFTLNDVINMTMAKKGKKGIELIIGCDADLPSGLLGDEKKIRRVIMNIVNNAIKFTNEGCISITVSGRKEDYGINLSVAVKDTGIGISEENQEKLFTSFSQVDTRRNRQEGGLGLGLAISRILIQKMGGTITVSSQPGKGTTVQFVVPQKILHASPITHIKDREKQNVIVYINMEQFGMVEIRDEYTNNILKMMDELGVRCHLCRNLTELKRRAARGQVTHIFISIAEYEEDKEYFDTLSNTVNVAIVIDEWEESRIGNPNIIRVYKPLYVLPIVAVLNQESCAGLGRHRICQGRFIAPNAHILAVDDNEMNLNILKGLLEKYQIQLTTALSGREALELIEKEEYDFVFMDHMMPEMDGVEVLHRIRKKTGSYYQKVPVIALTANAVAGSREMFLSEGFSDFLEKPIEASVLERVFLRNLPEEKVLMKDAKTEQGIEEAVVQTQKSQPQEQNGKPVIEGLDVEKGLIYCGGKEAYRRILQQYGGTGRETIDKIESLYQKEDWKNYTIEVHALKSCMLSIGAVHLSEQAKKQELAGKEGRVEIIKANHAAIMQEFQDVISLIRENPWVGIEAGGRREEKEKLPELKDEEFEQMIADMEEAVYELDDQKMLSIMEEMQKYSYCGCALLEELAPVKRKIEMSDYMSAAAVLRKRKEQIQKREKGGSAE